MSRLVRIEADQSAYYVKCYASRGRGLRRFMGRSRIRAEWENLQWFRAIGVPTADVVRLWAVSTPRWHRYQSVPWFPRRPGAGVSVAEAVGRALVESGRRQPGTQPA